MSSLVLHRADWRRRAQRLCIVAAVALATVARAGTWVSHGPEGGSILALAIDPTTPSTLYAATRSGGVFKSTDGGGSWTDVNMGLTNLDVHAVAVDPTNGNVVYAGVTPHSFPGATGIFKSTDGGGSWSPASAGVETSVTAFWIDPAM